MNNAEWLGVMHSLGLDSRFRERLAEEEILHRAGLVPRGVAGHLLGELGISEVWEYHLEGEGPVLLGRDVALGVARELVAAGVDPEGGGG